MREVSSVGKRPVLRISAGEISVGSRSERIHELPLSRVLLLEFDAP